MVDVLALSNGGEVGIWWTLWLHAAERSCRWDLPAFRKRNLDSLIRDLLLMVKPQEIGETPLKLGNNVVKVNWDYSGTLSTNR